MILPIFRPILNCIRALAGFFPRFAMLTSCQHYRSLTIVNVMKGVSCFGAYAIQIPFTFEASMGHKIIKLLNSKAIYFLSLILKNQSLFFHP